MQWEFATASTSGSHHRCELAPGNNQDAYLLHQEAAHRAGFAVVADGCGSGEHSEVGAQLGVHFFADAWEALPHRSVLRLCGPGQFTRALLDPVVARLRAALPSLGGLDRADRLREAVARYGLFTLNGVVWDDTLMVFFCVGDGVTIVNDTTCVVTPPARPLGAPDNAPDYLGYTVLDPQVPIRFGLHLVRATANVRSFVVATDGFAKLPAAAGRCLPGTQRLVGAVSELWRDDRYFTPGNRRLQQLLNLAARTKKKLAVGPDGPRADLETHPGLLDDDTTLIVGRRAVALPAEATS